MANLVGANSLLAVTRTATATLPAMRFTTLAGAVPSADDLGIGVNRFAAVSGDNITLDVAGVVLVEAAGAISDGDYVKTDAAGKAVTGLVAVSVGRALNATTADGDTVAVLLFTK